MWQFVVETANLIKKSQLFVNIHFSFIHIKNIQKVWLSRLFAVALQVYNEQFADVS